MYQTVTDVVTDVMTDVVTVYIEGGFPIYLPATCTMPNTGYQSNDHKIINVKTL